MSVTHQDIWRLIPAINCPVGAALLLGLGASLGCSRLASERLFFLNSFIDRNTGSLHFLLTKGFKSFSWIFECTVLNVFFWRRVNETVIYVKEYSTKDCPKHPKTLRSSALLQRVRQTAGEKTLTWLFYFLKELELCSFCKWKRI